MMIKEEKRKAGLGLGQVKVSHEKLTIQAVWALEALSAFGILWGHRGLETQS